MRLIICDRCGEKLPIIGADTADLDKPVRIEIRAFDSYYKREGELCPKCARELYALMNWEPQLREE